MNKSNKIVSKKTIVDYKNSKGIRDQKIIDKARILNDKFNEFHKRLLLLVLSNKKKDVKENVVDELKEYLQVAFCDFRILFPWDEFHTYLERKQICLMNMGRVKKESVFLKSNSVVEAELEQLGMMNCRELLLKKKVEPRVYYDGMPRVIIMPTGSGKTHLVNLYPHIFIDGDEIRENNMRFRFIKDQVGRWWTLPARSKEVVINLRGDKLWVGDDLENYLSHETLKTCVNYARENRICVLIFGHASKLSDYFKDINLGDELSEDYVEVSYCLAYPESYISNGVSRAKAWANKHGFKPSIHTPILNAFPKNMYKTHHQCEYDEKGVHVYGDFGQLLDTFTNQGSEIISQSGICVDNSYNIDMTVSVVGCIASQPSTSMELIGSARREIEGYSANSEALNKMKIQRMFIDPLCYFTVVDSYDPFIPYFIKIEERMMECKYILF